MKERTNRKNHSEHSIELCIANVISISSNKIDAVSSAHTNLTATSMHSWRMMERTRGKEIIWNCMCVAFSSPLFPFFISFFSFIFICLFTTLTFFNWSLLFFISSHTTQNISLDVYLRFTRNPKIISYIHQKSSNLQRKTKIHNWPMLYTTVCSMLSTNQLFIFVFVKYLKRIPWNSFGNIKKN